jgi:hypothetical protein
MTTSIAPETTAEPETEVAVDENLDNDRAAKLNAAVAVLREELADPRGMDSVTPEVLQQLMCESVRLYGRRLEEGDDTTAFPGNHGTGDLPSASEVCHTVLAMLESVSVEVFELGMFSTWATLTGGKSE